MLWCTADLTQAADDWVKINIYETMLSIISRMSNRVFLGKPDCYDQAWAQASLGYAESFTWTVMILKLFPSIFHPLVAWFLPSTWRLTSYMRAAQDALVPIIKRRQQAQRDGLEEKSSNHFLDWIIATAEPGNDRPEKEALRLLMVFLGAGHTSTMAATHTCYDLCSRPEYLEPLRAEVWGLLQEEGGWSKTVLNKMQKMDSFLKESQRLNPASARKLSPINFFGITDRMLSSGVSPHCTQASDLVQWSEAPHWHPSLRRRLQHLHGPTIHTRST